MMRFLIWFLVLMSAAVAVIWIQIGLTAIGTPPDPNDPAQMGGMVQAQMLRQSLRGMSDSLLRRELSGEISQQQFDNQMAQAANALLGKVDIKRIPPKQAWEYGEIYITAHRWIDAKKTLEVAVRQANDDDRRVNDNLRLARVEAELGNVTDAVKIAESVFDAPNGACAPILPASLLEIVPAGEHKGHDPALAGMLERAIACEERTVVDPNTQPGRDFLLARPVHIARAWHKIVELYQFSGKLDEASAAEKRAETMLRKQART